ncbi:hypothetical protein FJZ22_02745 [Candidatus Pacearchaeota archaeon]|nr:hypothetical protein [Candidatus Pacearchaeota archaeon]
MFAGKEVRVLLREQAKESFMILKQRNDKEAHALLRSIQQKIEILKINPQYGDPIKKELIPKEYLTRGITNLNRIELSHFWRMLYTIEGNKIDIFVFILSISDHPTYNKIFGYRKR